MFARKWYYVEDMRGVRLSVLNEVSAVVLNAQGRIFFSKFGTKSTDVEYLEPEGYYDKYRNESLNNET